MAQWGVVFAVAAVVVAWGGVQVARSGDELAEKAGLSRLFVGMLLVAAATSLSLPPWPGSTNSIGDGRR